MEKSAAPNFRVENQTLFIHPFFYIETQVGYELPDCTAPLPIRQLASELILLLDTERETRSATALYHSQLECRSVAQIPQLANTPCDLVHCPRFLLHTHHNVPDITLYFLLRVIKKWKPSKRVALEKG